MQVRHERELIHFFDLFVVFNSAFHHVLILVRGAVHWWKAGATHATGPAGPSLPSPHRHPRATRHPGMRPRAPTRTLVPPLVGLGLGAGRRSADAWT